MHCKHAILAQALAFFAHDPCVVSAAGDLHCAAERSDWKFVALAIDK